MEKYRYTATFSYRTKDDPTRLHKVTLQTNIGAFTLTQRKMILRDHLGKPSLEFNSILEDVEMNLGDGKPNLHTNKRDKVVHMSTENTQGTLCNHANAQGNAGSIRTWIFEKVTCKKCIDVYHADLKRKGKQ